jgi:transcription antitermination factor NusG
LTLVENETLKTQMTSSNTSEEYIGCDRAQWYALYVRSNQEKNVADSLNIRGIEHFLPCYRSLRRWKDRRVTLDLPLFPGYVFVRLPLLERGRALVPNVVSLVGTRTAPSPIGEDEVACIKRGLEHGKLEPHDYLTVGQRVVICGGVMSGMEGILVRQQSKARVVVSLDSISRAFVVEVDADWVRTLEAKHPTLVPPVPSPHVLPKREANPGNGVFAPRALFASY